MSEVREGYKVTELGEIPSEWEITELINVVDTMYQGINTVADKVIYQTEGIPILQAKHITSEQISFDGTKFISIKDYEKYKVKFQPEIGDILLTNIGTIGKVYFVDEFYKYLIAWNIFMIKVSQKINSNFLTYFLRRIEELGHYDKLTTGNATKFINKGQMGKILVPVPPLKEQQKIASILSTVDEQIDETEQLIVKTKELKKGLMQQLLTKGIGHTEFKQTELGEIPIDWEVTTLNDVLDIRDGTHDSPKYVDEGIPFVTSKNLKNGKLDFSDISYITEDDHNKFSNRSHVENGDILFGMIGTVGNPIIVDLPFEISIKNVALIKFSESKMINKFVIEYLNSNFVLDQFKKFSNGGVQKFIALGMIRKLKIIVPKIEEQQKIAQILSTVDEQIEVYEQEKAKYEELKKGLMQQLLTGQIRVKI